MIKSVRVQQNIAFTILWSIAGFTVIVLAWIIGYILVNGLPVINRQFLTAEPASMGREGGISMVIAGTFYLTILSILIATPIGISAAIFSTEYQRQGILVSVIRFFTETLAGVPSIVFGLFAATFFAVTLHLRYSLISGALVLAMIILPTIIRTTEEAIKAVDSAYKEGSLALGATLWTTVRKVVLPAAMPGIVTGVLLSVGRVIGESAALIIVCNALNWPASLMEPAKPMTLHLYSLINEGISVQKAFGTAAVLIIIVLLLNIFGFWWRIHYSKGR